MLNGNGGPELVPQPQPDMPVQGVQEEGQVGVTIEELVEIVAPGVSWFPSKRMYQ